MRARVWVLVPIAVGLSAGPARAERTGLLGYAPPGAPAAAGRALSAVERVARDDGDEIVTRPFRTARRRRAAGAVPRSQLSGFSRARQLIDEGWRAYLAVEAEFAAARLAEARRVALGVAHLPGGRALVADASLRLGAVLGHLDRDVQAAQALRLAARLDPAREVTVDRFAPEVVEAYRAASVSEAAETTLAIEVDPAGAGVEIDGAAVGTAPLQLEVGTGQHLVVARADGHRPTARLVVVTPDGAALDLRLEAAPRAAAVRRGPEALAAGEGESGASVALEGLVVYAELDAVVLAASIWRRGRPALIGQRCVGVPVRCTRVVEIRYPDADGVRAAAGALWRELSAEESTGPPTLFADSRLTNPEAPPGAPPPPGEDGCDWCRSGWLWVGVGVAALTAGTVALFARDDGPDFRVRVDPGDWVSR